MGKYFELLVAVGAVKLLFAERVSDSTRGRLGKRLVFCLPIGGSFGFYGRREGFFTGAAASPPLFAG